MEELRKILTRFTWWANSIKIRVAGKETQEPTRRSFHISAELAATLTEKRLNMIIKIVKINAIILQLKQNISKGLFKVPRKYIT